VLVFIRFENHFIKILLHITQHVRDKIDFMLSVGNNKASSPEQCEHFVKFIEVVMKWI
jgi:hypothetical protein